jgi:DNA-binding transcriptional LysR family regulator
LDRLDAMKVFLAAVDEGSLAGAARALQRSPAAVSRAISCLELHIDAELLNRSTRVMRLSACGESYAATCRRVLAELDEAGRQMANERSSPQGLLTLSASPAAGEDILRPIVDAFLLAYPAIRVRTLLSDRDLGLLDDGVDIALRVGALPDSSLVAVKVAGGVRRMIVAAPGYLAGHPTIVQPSDLAGHHIVALDTFGLESWIFPALQGSPVPRVVTFTPRIVVNSVRAALASAVDGMGVTQLYSYQLIDLVRAGALKIILRDVEHPPLPVHLLIPPGRTAAPKVRAFLDFAAPRLKAVFSRLRVQPAEPYPQEIAA